MGGREPFKKGKGTMPLTQEWNTKPGRGNEGQVGKCTRVMYHISTSSNSDLSNVFCCFPTFSTPFYCNVCTVKMNLSLSFIRARTGTLANARGF